MLSIDRFLGLRFELVLLLGSQYLDAAQISRWLRIIAQLFTRTRVGRALAFISLPLALVAIALYTPTYYPPIFDAQVHYNDNSWQQVSVKAVVNAAEELNVPWLLVGSTPNEGTWKLKREDPQRVIPMLIPGFSREDRDTWFNNPEITKYIEKEIRNRPYHGIGEFFLFDGEVNTPVVKRMVKLAVEHRLVLHARSDPQAIRQLFELDPSVRILWAHAGMFTQPETINELLYRYKYLWVEISHRGDVAPRGKLDPQWRELMAKHPDRFLLGSGTYSSKYWYQFRTYLSRYRGWLKDLPPELAEKIAYRNGLNLFGLDNGVSRTPVVNRRSGWK